MFRSSHSLRNSYAPGTIIHDACCGKSPNKICIVSWSISIRRTLSTSKHLRLTMTIVSCSVPCIRTFSTPTTVIHSVSAQYSVSGNIICLQNSICPKLFYLSDIPFLIQCSRLSPHPKRNLCLTTFVWNRSFITRLSPPVS